MHRRTVALVTGAAGFIGSHLCERLVASGEEVRGVDCFTDHYPRARKLVNVGRLLVDPLFSLVEADLAGVQLGPLVDGVDVIYHLAAQPAVRPSWGRDFGVYTRNNVEVTQRLLEACRLLPIRKFVYASSSSVYGDAETLPTSERVCPRPSSPYGVTKLAAEHLCELYRKNLGIPTASLRLFTVYGPRQRPDMAFARLVDAALRGGVFELYGDGEQTRDFTFVEDVVRAFHDAAESPWTGVANVGGGSRTSMNEVVELVRALAGDVRILRQRSQHGDVRHTEADTSVAATAFGYAPAMRLEEGLSVMLAARLCPEAVAPS